MKTKVISVGQVCCYCGTETKDGCCGEVHHEEGYVECDDQGNETGSCIILESELDDKYEII